MVTLSKFISNIYNITLIFLTLLYFEFVILLRSVTGNLPSSSTERLITNAQYLQLIEQKNPTILYTRKLKTNCLEECSVCLSEIEEGEDVRMLHCRHMFHRNCLDKWLLQWWATCPLCRAQVVPDEIVARHHQLQNQVDYDNGDEEIIFLISALHNNSLHRFF